MKQLVGILMLAFSLSNLGWGKTIVEEFDPGVDQEMPLDNPEHPVVSLSTGYTWNGYKGNKYLIQLLHKYGIESCLDMAGVERGYDGMNAWAQFGGDSVTNLGTITFKWLDNSASGNMEVKALIQDVTGQWFVSDDTVQDQTGATVSIDARRTGWKMLKASPIINTAIDLTDLPEGKPDLSEVTGGGFVTIGKGYDNQTRLDSMTWKELEEPVITDGGVFCSGPRTFTFRGKISAGSPDVSLQYWETGSTATSTVPVVVDGSYFSYKVVNLSAGEYNYFFEARNTLGMSKTDPVSFTVKEGDTTKSSIVETFGYPTDFDSTKDLLNFRGSSGVSCSTGYKWSGVGGGNWLFWKNPSGILLNSYDKEISGNLWATFDMDAVESPLYAQITMMSDSIHENANFFFVIQDAKGDWFVTEKYSVGGRLGLSLNEANWKRIDNPVVGSQFNTLVAGEPDFSFITGGGLQFTGNSEKDVIIESLSWKSEGEAPEIINNSAENAGRLSVLLSGSVTAGLPIPKVIATYWEEGALETNTVDVGTLFGDFTCRLTGLTSDRQYHYFFTATNASGSVNSETNSFTVTLPAGEEKTELVEDFGLPVGAETPNDDWVFTTTGTSSSTDYPWNGAGGGYRMYWYDKAGAGVIVLNSYNQRAVDGNLWTTFNGDTVKDPTLFCLKMASGSTHETTFVKPIIQDNAGNWFQTINEINLAKGERGIDLETAEWKQIKWPELGKQIVEAGTAQPDLSQIAGAGVSFRGMGSKDVLFDSFSWFSQQNIEMVDHGVVAKSPLSVTLQGEVTAGAPMPEVKIQWWKKNAESEVSEMNLGRHFGSFQVTLENLVGNAKYGYRFVATNGSTPYQTPDETFTPPSHLITELLVRFDGSLDDQGVYQPTSDEIVPDGTLVVWGQEKSVANGVCTLSPSAGNGAKIWWKRPNGLSPAEQPIKQNFVMEVVMAYSPSATHYDVETLMSFGVYTRLYWAVNKGGLALQSWDTNWRGSQSTETMGTEEKHYALVHTVIDDQHSKIDFYVDGEYSQTLKLGPVKGYHDYNTGAGGIAFGNGTMLDWNSTLKATFGTYSAVSFSSFEGEFNPKTDFQIFHSKGTVLILE